MNRLRPAFALAVVSIALLSVLGAAGCPTNPPVVPSDADAQPPLPEPAPLDVDGAASLPARACANLRRLGCREGLQVDGGEACEAVIQKTLSGAFNENPKCLAGAATKAAARACGSVKCP